MPRRATKPIVESIRAGPVLVRKFRTAPIIARRSWFDAQGVEPLFPCGFGLSYTTFSITSPTVRMARGTRLSVTIDLANTGRRIRTEVAQVYLPMPPGLDEPPRRLIGWKKVPILVDGASSAHPFGNWSSSARSWAIAPGNDDVHVGSSSCNLNLAGTIRP